MNNVVKGNFPTDTRMVAIEPLSPIDLVKSNAKMAKDYDALKNVVSAEEFLKLVFPVASVTKLQAFNPDF